MLGRRLWLNMGGGGKVDRCPEHISKESIVHGYNLVDFCNLVDKPCLLDSGFDSCDTWEEMKRDRTCDQ